jgi:competence protein ComEC
MFKLRWGYLISGIITGSLLLFFFITSLPDGKLHIIFCNVGQGDGAYIRFPDGRDMVVDGGPDNKLLDCLGRHMPFWDRSIDMMLMTHPQKDHMQGFIELAARYHIGYFVRSDVYNTTQGYHQLVTEVAAKKIPTKFMAAHDRIVVGSTTLSFVWPSFEQVAKAHENNEVTSARSNESTNVLAAATIKEPPPGDLNDYCLVFFLRYGSFDALFTGDADDRVEQNYEGMKLADNSVEVLKVPHHGSRTGMTEEFIQWIRPKLAVISVGKNMYGHPTAEALDKLAKYAGKTLRTDKVGDIEVVSDGKSWWEVK